MGYPPGHPMGGGNHPPGGGNPQGSGPGMGGPQPPPQQSAAAEREQKQLEAATENLSVRVNDVKNSIAALQTKLETDPHLNWPSFLDSYSLISGQLNTLLKMLRNTDRTPALKKYICLPLLLSPDRDEELLKTTEGRVAQFSHDLVPHYLRTNPDPDVSEKHRTYEVKANSMSQEQASKQIMVLEKIMREVAKTINKEREDMDTRANSRPDMEKTCAVEDTFNLVAAVSLGKALKAPPMPQGPSHGGMGGPMGSRGPPPGGMMGGPGGPSGPIGPMGKMPSGLKTNIKSANQVHPYSRP